MEEENERYMKDKDGTELLDISSCGVDIEGDPIPQLVPLNIQFFKLPRFPPRNPDGSYKNGVFDDLFGDLRKFRPKIKNIMDEEYKKKLEEDEEDE